MKRKGLERYVMNNDSEDSDIDVLFRGVRGSKSAGLSSKDLLEKQKDLLLKMKEDRIFEKLSSEDETENYFMLEQYLKSLPFHMTGTYGSRTPCVQLNFKGVPETFVIDAGTGLHLLNGEIKDTYPSSKMSKEEKKAILRKDEMKLNIFISHGHTDHWEGFPFTSILYDHPGLETKIYYPKPLDEEFKGFEEKLRTFLRKNEDNFPLDFLSNEHRTNEGLKPIDFKSFEKNQQIDDFKKYGMTIKTYNSASHPVGGGINAFRFDHNNKAVVYLSDIKLPTKPEIDKDAELNGGHHEAKALKEFMDGADLLIADAHFRVEDFIDYFGHSSYRGVIDMAQISGIPRVALFHFSPEYSDKQIFQMQSEARTFVGEYNKNNVKEVYSAIENGLIRI